MNAFRSILILMFALAANSLVAEAANWPEKGRIQPYQQGTTPRPSDALKIKYKCGWIRKCDVSDFMKRMDVCALFVISAGQPVLHRYAKEDNGNECLATVSEERYGIKSVAKSVTSLLFGRVFTDPAFGTPIDINATSASDALAEIGLKYRDKGVTIWDLLHMSSGMLWSETESCDITIEDPPKDCPPKSYDTLKKAAEHRLKKAKFEPGSGTLRPFRYSGFDALLIGMLVEHRLKSVPGLQPPLLHKGLEHFVWQRLEMDKKADWKADTEFHPPAYCCLYTSAGDLALLGDWALQKFRVGTDAMAAWVRASVNDNRDSDSTEDCKFYGIDQQFNYGYQWWVLSGKRNGFTGIGKRGQFLHLFPDQNVVIVQLGDMKLRTPRKTCESMLVHRLIADHFAQ